LSILSSLGETLTVGISLVRARMVKIFVKPWMVTVAILAASGGRPPVAITMLAAIAVSAVSIGAYIYNDVVDLEMDRLNPKKRDNPLPSGKVSVEEAMRVVSISCVIGLALSFFLNIKAFLLCVAYTALCLAYSTPRIRFKKMFLLKEATMAAGCFLLSLMGGATVGSISTPVIFIGAFLFAYTMVGAPLDESFDVKEDERYGCKTLAMVLSWRKIISLMIFFTLVIMTLTPLTYRQLGFNTLFPIIMVGSCGISLSLLFSLLSRAEKGPESLSKLELGSLYICWVMMQVAPVLGSL